MLHKMVSVVEYVVISGLLCIISYHIGSGDNSKPTIVDSAIIAKSTI